MARLECIDGGWLELTPVGYHFPEISDHWDDWLYISWSGSVPRVQIRQKFDSSFLTAEVLWLVHFFEARRGSSPIRSAWKAPAFRDGA